MPGYAITAYKCPRFRVNPNKISFMIFGYECCPKTGRWHWQGFIETRRKLGYRQIQNLIGVKARVSRMRTTILRNVTYCLKNGNMTHLHGNSADPTVRRLIQAYACLHSPLVTKNQDASILQSSIQAFYSQKQAQATVQEEIVREAEKIHLSPEEIENFLSKSKDVSQEIDRRGNP